MIGKRNKSKRRTEEVNLGCVIYKFYYEKEEKDITLSEYLNEFTEENESKKNGNLCLCNGEKEK